MMKYKIEIENYAMPYDIDWIKLHKNMQYFIVYVDDNQLN